MPNEYTVVIVLLAILVALMLARILFLVCVPCSGRSVLFATKSIEYPQIATLMQTSLQELIHTLAQANTPIPNIYKNCGNSTVNSLKFCDHLKTSGSIEVGGIAPCTIAYGACQTGCQIACQPCHLIPFVSCKVPCTDCPNKCTSVYNSCKKALSASWSLNVLEVTRLANSMTVLPLTELTLRSDKNLKLLKMKIPVTLQPIAHIDVRTTAELGNYQGPVDLGKITVVIPAEFQFNCTTRQLTLKKLDKLQVLGIHLNFHFANTFVQKFREILYNAVKNKITPSVKQALENQLTPLFKDWITSQLVPKLQSPLFALISC